MHNLEEELRELERNWPTEAPPISLRDAELFEATQGWKHIRYLLFSHLIGSRDHLETLGEGHDRNEISHEQGMCKTLRLMIDLPVIIKDVLKEEAKEKEQNERSEE